MGSPSIGVAAKAAFRLNSGKGIGTGQPYPALASDLPIAQYIGTAYDKLALMKHGLKENANFEMNDDVLDGTAGTGRMDKIGVLPGGPIDIKAGYLGLDQLFAAALGFEKIRHSSLESPVYGVSGNGSALTGTTAAGSTTTTLIASSGVFTADTIIGDWVRLGELTTTPTTKDMVRKITARGSTTEITVAPAWGVAGPGSGIDFAVAREFLHTYEVSKHLHSELFSDILSGAWSTGLTAYLVRNGALVFYNGFGYDEWQCAMVKKLTLKLGPSSGLMITAEMVPVYRDLTNDNSQDHTKWNYLNGSLAAPASGASFMVYERCLFPDAKFLLNAFSTGTALDDDDKQSISEFELSIENPFDDGTQTLATGLYRAESVRSGNRKIEGSFTYQRHIDNTRINYFKNESNLMGSLQFTGSTIATGKTNELKIWMRRMRLKTPDTSLQGKGPTPEKHEFTCLECDDVTGAPAGMPTPTTGFEKGELIIQTRNQNPFNAFMGQNAE